MNNENKFKSVSPSAKALMRFKAHTQIAYASQTAKALLDIDENTEIQNNDFGFWASVVHFENRYYSINELISEVSSRNVLELSAGFNFRGLEFTNLKNKIHYIDTDLTDIITEKKQIASSFSNSNPVGRLEYAVLNALDEEQFQSIVDRFDNHSLTIINEGLLVYLSIEEKNILCNIIRTQLERKQGYWVTSDIYINHKPGQIGSDKDKKWSKFFSKLNSSHKCNIVIKQ